MSFELFVASRFLRSERKGLFALITTFIGVAGVAIGVAALITTLSVMNGFQSDIEGKIIGAQAHVVIYGDLSRGGLGLLESAVKRYPETAATAPFALGQAIVTYRGQSAGVVLRGLDPAREFQVNDLAKTLRTGSWDALSRREGHGAGNGTPSCVLGEELAKILGVWVGDEVILVSPQSASVLTGLMPKMRRFRVAGLLQTGYYEYDSSTVYASLGDVAAFLGLKGGASGLEVRLRDLDEAEPLARRMQRDLGLAYTVRSFKQMNQTLFAALRLEKYVMFLILTLIILVASLNIASTLILMGTEKLRNIGLLKAMGASPRQIRRIFLWEGALIGSIGVGLGLALGLGLSFLIRRYPLVELPADIYYLSRVPVHVDWRDVAVITSSAVLLTLLATLYPALRASRVNPVEAIHYG